ncbi:glutamate--cysteine ligase [Verticiella sediminum]|uniref:Putative glutamate--cysteine ligase 2 n=1 Tax=Verticiella sediminum TaxID=1247510 RepID=A0A556AMN3_9BURK|nr:YbdK family carboxylate-amine ligase [Verticiella sediminum]TSH94149.1 glutamate--cysteine ligase [Verticiella sediminum]
MHAIEFTPSRYNTLGIELELQLLDPRTLDLSGQAASLLEHIAGHPSADHVKPELTRAMIELNSSVHEHPAGLLAEMRELRDLVCEAGDAIGVRVAGGGAHPFTSWRDCDIHDSPRYRRLADLYGYLARQFTVFGQHIHLGVASGDAACGLIHRLSPYVPHFIALAASSPFREGEDTLFACSRLHALHSFPLAGHMPEHIRDWYQFEAHYTQMRSLGLTESLKDLYWDIRPKPELGTVELRVCDTPLTVEKACQLAAFAQALAIAVQRASAPTAAFWMAYETNRFQACRFGLHANYVTRAGERVRLIEHLRGTFEQLMPVADELGTTDLLGALREDALRLGNDARWLRARHHELRELPAVAAAAADVWRGEPAGAAQAGPGRRRVRASSEPIVHGLPLLPEGTPANLPPRLH